MGHRKRVHFGIGRNRKAKFADQRRRLGLQRAPTDQAGHLAQQDVLGNGQIARQRHFLMDDGNAALLGVVRRDQPRLLPVYEHCPA